MVSDLLHEVDHNDIELWVEDNKLKYRSGQNGFPEHLKEVLKQSKDAIIERLKENQMAQESGWSIIHFGESYCKRLSFSSEIYIFRDLDDTCSLWRGYWKQGERDPHNQKTFVSEVTFQEALHRGNDYIQWLNSNKRKAI